MADPRSTVSRRSVLLLSTAALTSTTGCLSWIRGGSSGDDSDADNSEGHDDAAVDEEINSSQSQDNASGTENTPTEQQEDGADNSSSNENKGEKETGNETDERQARPDDEDTEIDRDQYNESESKEVEDLPQSYVEVPRDTVKVTRDSTNTIKIEATIRNTSDQDIDFVDIEVIYLENGTRVGTDIVVVEDLDAGESEQFSTQTSPVDLRGDPTDVGFNPLPQNYNETDGA